MQKNDSICENIFREHLDLIYGSNDMELLNSRFGGCANRNWSITSTRTLPIVSHPTDKSSKKDEVKHTEVALFEKIERSFKEKLKLSPEFFRLFLIADKNKLINNVEKFIGSLENKGCITDPNYNQISNNRMEIYGMTFDIDRIFRKCFYWDRFKKKVMKKAKNT